MKKHFATALIGLSILASQGKAQVVIASLPDPAPGKDTAMLGFNLYAHPCTQGLPGNPHYYEAAPYFSQHGDKRGKGGIAMHLDRTVKKADGSTRDITLTLQDRKNKFANIFHAARDANNLFTLQETVKMKKEPELFLFPVAGLTEAEVEQRLKDAVEYYNRLGKKVVAFKTDQAASNGTPQPQQAPIAGL